MRIRLAVVLLLLVSGSGCIELPLLHSDSKAVAAATREHPVTASELDAVNAHDIADALRDELDRDEQNLKTNTPAPTAKN